jgi:hypothetical protein
VLRISVAVALVVAVAFPGAAFPCGNAVYLEKDDAVKQLKQAEIALEAGDFDKALRLTSWQYEYPDAALARRARMVQQVGALRGGKPQASPMLARTANAEGAKRIAAIVEALEQIRTEAGEKSSDAPLFTARLAEGYLAAGKREEAKGLIEDLAKRDLIPDAHGYLTLAAVRDGKQRDEALGRCKTVAKKKTICVLPSPNA